MPAFQDPLLVWATAWHLVMATAGALVAMLAREAWQKQAEQRFRTTWLAFASITGIQLVLAALALWPIVPLPIVRMLDAASALLIGWGLAAPFVSRAMERGWLLSGLVGDTALGVAALVLWWMAPTRTEPAWTLVAWGLLSAVGAGLGALVLWYNVRERPKILIGALGVLGLGALVWTLGPETAGRALWLAAFVTLPTGVARWMLREMESTEQELQSFSQHALRQTQQLLVLLRSSTTLVSQASVSAMLTEAVEGIALGTGADLAMIALIGDDPDKTATFMAIYPPRAAAEVSFPLNSHVVIAQAVHTNQQTILEPDIGLERHPLHTLLGKDAGPVIVQPMTCQDRTIGVILVGNTHGREPLSKDAGRLLEALGAQIATAVENVRMYHRLNTQAKELARLLTIREEEASQRAAILESIADGVIVTNKDDRIILVNAAAATILGLTRDELVSRSAEEVFDLGIPLPLHVFRVSDDASLLNMVRLDFERNDRSVQASLAPVQTASGELLGVVAVLRDVTRERQAERAKTEFIATISHELRTPLTSIKGYADLMSAGVMGALNEAQQGFVSKIRAQADHLVRLINEVIQYSELERGGVTAARQPFEMGELVQQVLEAQRKRIEESGFQVNVQVESDTPPAQGDPLRTRQIIEQLLDNALRFTPAPGHILFSVRSISRGADTTQPAHVVLAVSDTGVGIAPQDLERIFERFYRADNPLQVQAGGLGLGLTIARAFAVAQGGKLWADSPALERPADMGREEHPGATFTLMLPAG